jgi:3-deoxy-D-arabino-heptulosonate 7-phosphate (DAHP) synthase
MADFCRIGWKGNIIQNHVRRKDSFSIAEGVSVLELIDCWIVSLVLPIASCLIVVDDPSFRDQYPECLLGMFQ